MAARLFLCPACHEPHQFDAMTMAESPKPLFYTCLGCQHQVTELPEEIVEQRSAPKRRVLGVF